MLDPTILDLAFPEGFHQRFEEARSKFPELNARKVYEHLEGKHQEVFGRRKYTSYHSFRNSKRVK